MPLSEELTTLLTLLRRGTEKKVLKWAKTPSLEVFRVELPDGAAVRIVRDESFSDEDARGVRFILTLLNREGRVLDEWDSHELGQEAEQLYELYRLARRSATNYENELSRILTVLKQRIPEEEP